MGCAQSRNGGYYPSFLEGPIDRINSNDPQSAVDFVDRVLDQIDVALDGERPEPTRTFTAAEAEVVKAAWRGAGLLPAKLATREGQDLQASRLEFIVQALQLSIPQGRLASVGGDVAHNARLSAIR